MPHIMQYLQYANGSTCLLVYLSGRQGLVKLLSLPSVLDLGFFWAELWVTRSRERRLGKEATLNDGWASDMGRKQRYISC